MKNDINIIRPSEKEIKKYLRLWDSLENYTLQESSLRKLFTKTPFLTQTSDIPTTLAEIFYSPTQHLYKLNK